PGRPPALRVVRAGRIEQPAEIDAAFARLHGACGEAGPVQGIAEPLHTPDVASGPLASAASMDKAATKQMLRAAGIGTAPGIVLHEDLWAREGRRVQAHLCENHPLPWFVKPARAGSSLGVTRVNDPAELDLALKNAFAEDPK